MQEVEGPEAKERASRPLLFLDDRIRDLIFRDFFPDFRLIFRVRRRHLRGGGRAGRGGRRERGGGDRGAAQNLLPMAARSGRPPRFA